MTKPSYKLIGRLPLTDRLRLAALSSFRCVLIMIFTLTLVILGFYMNRLRLQNSYHFTPKYSRCPVSEVTKDVCIYPGVDMTELTHVCGSMSVTTLGDCQDRFYTQIVVPSHAIDAVSDHTYNMVVQGAHVGDDVDRFVQKHSRWVIDIWGVKGYEVLTTFEDKDRTSLHQHLDLLQNQCERFFSGGIESYGFGSSWHNEGLALAYALYRSMTLFSPSKREFFIPITTCTENDMKRSFETHPPETDYGKWDNTTFNYKSIGETDVWDLYRNNGIILPEFEAKGYFWWRSMLTYYLIRPNAHMREMFRGEVDVANPCISIHVRHSDKAAEAQLFEFSRYMEEAEQFRNKTGTTNIFLMTDDDLVVQSSKNYTNFRFLYRDVLRSNQGWIDDVTTGRQSRTQQELDFLLDVYSAARCQHSVLTYSSNVGRLIAEIVYATRNKEPDVVSLDYGWIMSP